MASSSPLPRATRAHGDVELRLEFLRFAEDDVVSLGAEERAGGQLDLSDLSWRLRICDAAYDQGTVWGWLIGPCIDAWMKVHPDDAVSAHGFPGPISGTSRRSPTRHDQRSFRRAGTAHGARLHPPGVEGRGSVAFLSRNVGLTFRSLNASKRIPGSTGCYPVASASLAEQAFAVRAPANHTPGTAALASALERMKLVQRY